MGSDFTRRPSLSAERRWNFDPERLKDDDPTQETNARAKIKQFGL
jgi:hypothetical protein